MQLKQFLLLMFLLAGNLICSAQYIKNKKYEGYIFKKNDFVFLSFEGQKERYTPTLDNINYAETIIVDNISFLNKKLYESNFECISKRNLRKKYKRQYVGFINNKNEIIIWVNFIKNNIFNSLSNELIEIFDGGSDQWSVFINLNTHEFFKMEASGTSLILYNISDYGNVSN